MTEETFKAIADSTRRHILDLLRISGAMRAGEIAQAFPKITRPAVSKHLRVLREANLIIESGGEDGRERLYQLNPTPLQAVSNWLHDYDALWDKRMTQLKQLVEEDQS